MGEQRVMMVTGVTTFWGRRVAQQLVQHTDYHVIGLAAETPNDPLPTLDFVRADLRNPLLVELLQLEQVDTVCHLDFTASVRKQETVFDRNVMGTTRLFAACAEAGVGQIVWRSQTAVYGAHPSNPAFLREDYPLSGDRSMGTVRDLMDMETFSRDFARQYPDVRVATLRLANVVGTTAPSPFNRCLNHSVAPMLLGFDPMMQFIHEDDAVAALAYAVENGANGIFNVAAPELMPLTRVLALTNTAPIPIVHPFAYWGSEFLRGTRLNPQQRIPYGWDYLRYRWVGDTTAMQEQFGFVPEHSAVDALRQLAGQKRMRPYQRPPDALEQDKARLRATLAQRRRARQETELTQEPT